MLRIDDLELINTCSSVYLGRETDGNVDFTEVSLAVFVIFRIVSYELNRTCVVCHDLVSKASDHYLPQESSCCILDVFVLIVPDMCDKFLLPTLFTCKLVFFYMGDYKKLSSFNLIIRRKAIL